MNKRKYLLNLKDGFFFKFLHPDSFISPMVDKVLSVPVIFTLIVITQGVFGGYGISNTPKILKKLANTWIGRILYLLTIAYTATSDIETAIVGTIVFYFILHILRTEEERKELKSFI